MARSSVKTQLSLDRFAAVLGIHPLHFNQVVVEELAPANGCGSPLVQYAWQASDRVGREDIATAIATAEDRLSQYLGFDPLPQFHIDEPHSWPGYRSGARYGYDGFGLPVKLDRGYIVAMGIETKTLIDADAAITYSDEDGDGYAETATITFAVTSTSNVDEIAVYYPGEAAADEWEIRPLASVAISGGIGVVRFARHQAVKPELLEALAPQAVNGLIDDNFLTAVDVYRKYVAPSPQLSFLVQNRGCSCADGVVCQSCYTSAYAGCANIRDARLSLVIPSLATYNSDTGVFDYAAWDCVAVPNRVVASYKAGWRYGGNSRPSHNMDPKWERAIAYYAASLLDRPLCGCQTVENITNYWGNDLSMAFGENGRSTSYRLTPDVLGNPFGPLRGQIHAWNLASRERIGEAVCV